MSDLIRRSDLLEMNDLIDRERLREERPEWLNTNNVDNSEFNRGWNECNDYWLKVIDDQPTAYDVEKVLAQLKLYKDRTTNFDEDIISGITNDAYDVGICHATNEAIRIVKRGGVDDSRN